MRVRVAVAASVLLWAAAQGRAQSLTQLASFGGGDGWRAPGEVLAGDAAGTATNSVYNYLGTGSLERGLAFNPVSGNLILVSRSTAGNGIRVLNGLTGADAGSLAQGSGIIAGGTFTVSAAGAGADGAVYVANLTTNASTTAFKVYRWADDQATTTPTVAHPALITGFTGTPRLGDTFDVTGGGANTRLAAGASGSVGYAVFSTADGLTYTGAAVTPAAAGTLAPGDFRLGATFAQPNQVWGKQTGQRLERTAYSPSAASLGSNALVSAGEAPMDYVTLDVAGAARAFLATVDANNSTVRVYDATDPANLVLLATGNATLGTLTANGNGVGQVKFGAYDAVAGTVTLYAMSTNQGIQAFSFSPVPEPALALVPAALVLAALRRRAGRLAARPCRV